MPAREERRALSAAEPTVPLYTPLRVSHRTNIESALFYHLDIRQLSTNLGADRLSFSPISAIEKRWLFGLCQRKSPSSDLFAPLLLSGFISCRRWELGPAARFGDGIDEVARAVADFFHYTSIDRIAGGERGTDVVKNVLVCGLCRLGVNRRRGEWLLGGEGGAVEIVVAHATPVVIVDARCGTFPVENVAGDVERPRHNDRYAVVKKQVWFPIRCGTGLIVVANKIDAVEFTVAGFLAPIVDHIVAVVGVHQFAKPDIAAFVVGDEVVMPSDAIPGRDRGIAVLGVIETLAKNAPLDGNEVAELGDGKNLGCRPAEGEVIRDTIF